MTSSLPGQCVLLCRKKPALHEQKAEPGILMQLCSHRRTFSLHSSISKQTHLMLAILKNNTIEIKILIKIVFENLQGLDLAIKFMNETT